MRLGRLPASEALLITRDLLEVIDAAHRASVIHRDIKPDNVFLESAERLDGRAPLRLLDFGIARLRELKVEGTSTRQGFLLGTPAFMAPEQALGRWDRVDARTDLWAVGATLYAMLAGRAPREGEDIAVLLAAASEALADVRDAAPDVPHEVAALVARATAVDMDARFANALEMRETVAMCRRALETTNAAIALQKLVRSIPAPREVVPAATTSQDFDRSELALSSELPLIDDDATRFDAIPAALIAELRRPRAAPAAEEDPTQLFSRDGENPFARTMPDGVPVIPVALIAAAQRRTIDPLSVTDLRGGAPPAQSHLHDQWCEDDHDAAVPIPAPPRLDAPESEMVAIPGMRSPALAGGLALLALAVALLAAAAILGWL